MNEQQFTTGTDDSLQVRSQDWTVSPIPMSDIDITVGGVVVPIRCRRQVLFGVVEAFGELAEAANEQVGSTYKLTTRELLDDIDVFVTPQQDRQVEIRCTFHSDQARDIVPTELVQRVATELKAHFQRVYANQRQGTGGNSGRD